MINETRSSRSTSRRRWLNWTNVALLMSLLLLLLSCIALYHTSKPLPAGLSYDSGWHVAKEDEVELLYNLAYPGPVGVIYEEQIYSAWYEAVEQAESWIVLDMFLFNGYMNEGQAFPPLSRELTDRILLRMEEQPELQVVVISDEINTTYGSHQAEELERLREAGANITLADTDALRDSNPLYSSVWRGFIGWFGQSGRTWLPNALADNAPKVTARSYLKLLNVKANHRKVLLTEKTGIVTSANAHEASYYNSNMAIRFGGSLLTEVLEAELAVIRYSGGQVPELEPLQANGTGGRLTGEPEGDTLAVRWLTEGKIKERTLEMIQNTDPGEQLWMGMFYLADREVIDALVEAANRGTDVRLILDPNENAFGQQKIGLPNRPVAAELLERAPERLQLRWYNTTEEQYHTKTMMVVGYDRSRLTTGSTNFTERNLEDFNLEANIEISAPSDAAIMQNTLDHFRMLWNNTEADYTLPYSAYAEELPWIKRSLYGLQKLFSFTTF